MGGASGGYTAGNKTVIEWLRQRSRPYLFSNSVAPAMVGGAMTFMLGRARRATALTRAVGLRRLRPATRLEAYEARLPRPMELAYSPIFRSGADAKSWATAPVAGQAPRQARPC